MEEKLKFVAKSFRKLEDPCLTPSKHIKYVCYTKVDSIPLEIEQWMGTNPREQKMTTNVATAIKESLTNNSNFHELNRGILISAQSVDWDPKTNNLIITFANPEIHGNIDGGHTLRAILNAISNNTLDEDRYVFFEIFTGIDSPVELAAARNTSVQVDLKSIEELKNHFEPLKKVFDTTSFKHRIQYKMNEHYNEDSISPIDVREIISILIMFSQEIYPYLSNNNLTENQPIQCYSGKEASLKKFLYFSGSSSEKEQRKKREKMLENMSPIIKDIFELWEEIEVTFAQKAMMSGRRYGTRKYSKYDNGINIGKSYFEEKPIQYVVPKGLMYPLTASFRALIDYNKKTGEYSWKYNPKEVWDKIGEKLVAIILDEKSDTPDTIGKNSNLWSNLFKEVFIYARI